MAPLKGGSAGGRKTLRLLYDQVILYGLDAVDAPADRDIYLFHGGSPIYTFVLKGLTATHFLL
jgi:hypothetical protein